MLVFLTGAGTTSDNSEILKRLEKWEQKDGSLPAYIELYRQLTSLQAETEAHVSPANLRVDVITSRLKAGQALLTFDQVPFDWPLVQDLLRKIARLLAEHVEDCSGAISQIENIAASESSLRQVAAQWYEQAPSAEQKTDSREQEILAFALSSAFKPFLAVQARALLPAVDQELWRRGYCPICGGKPDFAFLDKEQSARWLLCSRCDAHWLFQRLECPYCGNTDHKTLSYLSDDSSRYRVYVCDKCHSYIKTIDLRLAAEEVVLPLERLLTVDLDLQAEERGYRAGQL